MITKQDLILNPKDEYMNDEQLAFFTYILNDQKEEILKSLKDARIEMTKSDISADLNDAASSQEIQQIQLSAANSQSKMLNDINKALDRIKTKEYGYCEVSGKPIGIKRLLAQPTANLSIYESKAIENMDKRHHQRLGLSE